MGRGRDIKTIHSQPSTNYTVILIIIIPLLNVSNSSGLDVMDSPLNCFYQRFVTYLVWRSLKRPVQVTLLNLGLAARDITLSALRTTERLKFWGLSGAL